MSNFAAPKTPLTLLFFFLLLAWIVLPPFSPAHSQVESYPPGYGVYLLSGERWIKLEYQLARRVPAGEMGYVMGIMHRSRALLRGERSPIRISGPYPFIYLHGAQPDFYTLVQLEARDGLRQFHYSTYTAGGSPQVVEEYRVPVAVEKVGKDLYRMAPARALPPGEYGLALGDHICPFGVD